MTVNGSVERKRRPGLGEPRVQGVDELPDGGAVRDAAGGLHGAADDGGRVRPSPLLVMQFGPW